MTTFVVPAHGATRPRLRRHAARVTPDPPCGACKSALRWALRDDGDRPLSAERCRAAAAALARLIPADPRRGLTDYPIADVAASLDGVIHGTHGRPPIITPKK